MKVRESLQIRASRRALLVTAYQAKSYTVGDWLLVYVYLSTAAIMKFIGRSVDANFIL